MRGSAIEVAVAPGHDVNGHADAPQHAVNFTTAKNRVRSGVRNHYEKIEVAVRAGVTPCFRAKKVDANRLIELD